MKNNINICLYGIIGFLFMMMACTGVPATSSQTGTSTAQTGSSASQATATESENDETEAVSSQTATSSSTTSSSGTNNDDDAWGYKYLEYDELESDYPSFIRHVANRDDNALVFRANNSKNIWALNFNEISGLDEAYVYDESDVEIFIMEYEDASVYDNANGGMHMNVAYDDETFFVAHVVTDTSCTSTYKTVLSVGYFDNDGSWTDYTVACDVWAPAVFVDNSGNVHVWVSSVSSTDGKQSAYKFTKNSSSYTKTTSSSSISTCKTISTSTRRPSSAVFNQSKNKGYVAYMCTASGSNQGLYVSVYSASSATWSSVYLNSSSYYSERVGESPVAFTYNDNTAIMHRADNGGKIYIISESSSGTWSSETVVSDSSVVSGENSVTVKPDRTSNNKDTIYAAFSSGGTLHLYHARELGSGSWEGETIDISATGTSFTPVEVEAFVFDDDEVIIAIADDDSRNIMFLKKNN